jgi:hypothetical protein
MGVSSQDSSNWLVQPSVLSNGGTWNNAFYLTGGQVLELLVSDFPHNCSISTVLFTGKNSGSGTTTIEAWRTEYDCAAGGPNMVLMGSSGSISFTSTWAVRSISTGSFNTNLDRTKYGIVLKITAGTGNVLWLQPMPRLTLYFYNVLPYEWLARF